MALVLYFTCPFQITSNQCLACRVNTESSMGLGCAWSICPTFAAAILHKNDKQLVWVMNTQYAYGTRYELEQQKPVCTMRIQYTHYCTQSTHKVFSKQDILNGNDHFNIQCQFKNWIV